MRKTDENQRASYDIFLKGNFNNQMKKIWGRFKSIGAIFE